MGDTKFLLVAILALNVYFVASDSDQNLSVLEELVNNRTAILTDDYLETCYFMGLLDTRGNTFLASGYMTGFQTGNVVYNVAAYGKSEELERDYRKSTDIFLKLKDLMAKDGYRAANKNDALEEYGLLPYLRPIEYQDIKLFPMPELDPIEYHVKSNSNGHLMLSTDDLAAFARQMVRTVATLHKIGYALETINHKDYMTWNLELHHVGPSGPFGLIDKKKYVPDHKKIQKATPNLMKKNWHEVLESMAELLGAFERDEKYGNLTSMKKKAEKWNLPTENLTSLMKAQRKQVDVTGNLEPHFVESFKSCLKELPSDSCNMGSGNGAMQSNEFTMSGPDNMFHPRMTFGP